MAVIGWNVDMKAGGWAVVTLKSNLGAGDTTENLELPNYPDKCVQIRLVSGVLTDLDFMGSNNGSNFFSLHRLDAPSSVFDNLAASLMANVVENPRFMAVTAVAGTTPVVEIIILAYTAR